MYKKQGVGVMITWRKLKKKRKLGKWHWMWIDIPWQLDPIYGIPAYMLSPDPRNEDYGMDSHKS